MTALLAVAVLLLLLAYAWTQHRRAAAQAAYVAELERFAQARADDFALLLRLASQLSGALDIDDLKRAITVELSALVGTTEFWVVAQVNGWTLLAGEEAEPGSIVPCTITEKPDAWECFPLVTAGKTVGLMGIKQPEGRFTDEQRQTLAALRRR